MAGVAMQVQGSPLWPVSIVVVAEAQGLHATIEVDTAGIAACGAGRRGDRHAGFATAISGAERVEGLEPVGVADTGAVRCSSGDG